MTEQDQSTLKAAMQWPLPCSESDPRTCLQLTPGWLTTGVTHNPPCICYDLWMRWMIYVQEETSRNISLHSADSGDVDNLSIPKNNSYNLHGSCPPIPLKLFLSKTWELAFTSHRHSTSPHPHTQQLLWVQILDMQSKSEIYFQV